jgi:hypothetical protein
MLPVTNQACSSFCLQMSAAVARPAMLPMKRARAMPPAAALTNGAHDDTHPDFTIEVAKMLATYIAAYGELPCTESIPAPVVHAKIGDLPTRNLLDVSGVTGDQLGIRIINQDIPLHVYGIVLHLEITLDIDKLTFTALARLDHVPIVGSVKIGECNIGLPGQRCEFGYNKILHAALYIQDRTLKLDLDVLGNHTTINIISF